MPSLIEVIENQAHPEFEQHKDEFRLWRAATRGRLDAGKTRELITRDSKIKNIHPQARRVSAESLDPADLDKLDNWLYRFELESDWSYEQRMLLAHDFGESGRIVSSFVGHLARSARTIEFDFGTEVNDKIGENIDNEFTSLSVFEKEVSAEVFGMGKAWVLVNATSFGMPFAEIIPREKAIDWHHDSETGNLVYFKWKERRVSMNGIEREYIEQIKIITTEEFIIAEKHKKRWVIVSQEANPIGIVPVVDIWQGSDALPIIQVASKIQVNKLNLDSELRHLIRQTCLSFLQLPKGGSQQLKALSANSYLEVSADAAGVAKWIPYPASSLEPYFTYFKLLSETINESSNMKGMDSRLDISGLSKQWDFLNTETTLARHVDALAPGMKQILELFGAWRGLTVDVVYDIEKKFDVRALSERIDQIMKAMAIGLGPTAEKNLREQLIEEMVRVNDDDMKLIDQELEELGRVPEIPMGLDVSSES